MLSLPVAAGRRWSSPLVVGRWLLIAGDRWSLVVGQVGRPNGCPPRVYPRVAQKRGGVGGAGGKGEAGHLSRPPPGTPTLRLLPDSLFLRIFLRDSYSGTPLRQPHRRRTGDFGPESGFLASESIKGAFRIFIRFSSFSSLFLLTTRLVYNKMGCGGFGGSSPY